MQRKRRQHYVWKRYLESWVQDGKIWCLRRGQRNAFQTNPINVAVERDFYKIQTLNRDDLAFIYKVAIEPSKGGPVHDLNIGWLNSYGALLSLFDAFKNDKNPRIVASVDEALHNLDEDLHAKLESESYEYLVKLTDGDSSIFDSDRDAVQFLFFLAHQYLRTKRVRTGVLKQFSSTDEKKIVARTFPVLCYIFATNISLALAANRNTKKIILLENTSEVEFITGDQPIINTYATYKSPYEQIEEIELYYPVTPRRAVLITDHATYLRMDGNMESSFQVTHLNQKVEFSALEQIFAASEQTLERAFETFL